MARKETTKIAAAFALGQPARAARTHTDGARVYLHGNEIAHRRDDGTIALTAAGWPTRTTVDRLNGIATECNLPVRFDLRGGLHVTDHGHRRPVASTAVLLWVN